mgnify:CR=1 FL=1
MIHFAVIFAFSPHRSREGRSCSEVLCIIFLSLFDFKIWLYKKIRASVEIGSSVWGSPSRLQASLGLMGGPTGNGGGAVGAMEMTEAAWSGNLQRLCRLLAQAGGGAAVNVKLRRKSRKKAKDGKKLETILLSKIIYSQTLKKNNIFSYCQK